MNFDVTILGCNGAIPAYDRHPTSQYINYNGTGFLVDCGEGTQSQMNRYNIKRGKLNYIFISHLHGDHFFGLMGLLTSFNLNYRDTPLYIFGPEGIEEIVKTHFKWSKTTLRFELFFTIVKDDKPFVVFENEYLTVSSIPLRHRIPTTGYIFREKKKPRKIIAEKISSYNIPIEKLHDIKDGNDFILADGTVIKNSELTTENTKPRAYAFCSDTVFFEELVSDLNDIDLLYHEATFSMEHAARAKETMHSTTTEAATIAKMANVKNLLIGHFSARYEDLTILLSEAKSIFTNTEIAKEGTTFIL